MWAATHVGIKPMPVAAGSRRHRHGFPYSSGRRTAQKRKEIYADGCDNMLQEIYADAFGCMLPQAWASMPLLVYVTQRPEKKENQCHAHGCKLAAHSHRHRHNAGCLQPQVSA